MTGASSKKIARAIAVVAALPVLGGAQECIIILDYLDSVMIIDPVTEMRLTVDHGVIELVAGPRTGLLLHRHVVGFDTHIGSIDETLEDETLVAEALCDESTECDVDYFVELPLGVTIVLDNPIGGGKYTALDAAFRATIGEGDVEGSRLRTPTFELELEAGRVSLGFSIAPDLVRIRDGAGDVELRLPAGNYLCDLTGRNVTIAPAIVCDPSATAVLEITADDGDVNLLEEAP
jgi:hypothetical protein